MNPRPNNAAFSLLEMLVATAVFSLMIVMLLQLTNSLLSNANRTDDNLQTDQDVRILFDLMRRDIAQARIGTNQNQFYGSSNQISFVSSTSRLKTNYVSDQRLITYFLRDNTIYRAVVEPTMANYLSTAWNPIDPNGWTNVSWAASVATNAEALLAGVYPYDADFPSPFSYTLRPPYTNKTSPTNSTAVTDPPSGLTVGFAVASKRALSHAVAGKAPNASELRKLKYDIELNIPPAYNP